MQTDRELTLTKMHFLCGDARSQERFQRISDPFYLLHFTVFYLTEIKDLSIRGTNLQRLKRKNGSSQQSINSSGSSAIPVGAEGGWQCWAKPSLPFPHHAVHAADWPRLWFQLPAEELAEVPVVVQILHGRLLHVHPKGPDVQAVHWLPQPRGQLHLVQATPGPWQQPGGDRLVQGNLQEELQHVSALPAHGITQEGSNSSCNPLPWIHGLQLAFKAAKSLHCTSSSFPPFWRE